jgi:hypothetical protein
MKGINYKLEDADADADTVVFDNPLFSWVTL